MDFEFSDYLLEAVAFAKARQIASRVTRSSKKYDPGRFGVEIEFVPRSQDIEDDIDRWTDSLTSMGAYVERHPDNDDGRTSWGVFDDQGNVEITTPPLNLKELPFLKQVLGRVGSEKFTGSTSAHVHIGMPNDTDPFDLLSMTTLVDEAQMRMDAGANRDFDQFAKPNAALHDVLYRAFEPGEYDSHDVMEILKTMERDFGTNLRSFFKHGTVEYRYLSSQVVRNPDVFCNWIEYFLLMPRVARSRQQIRLKTSQGDIVFSRLAGGKVRVDKTNQRVPMANQPVDDLRNPQPTTMEKAKEDLAVRKLGRLTFRDLGNKMPPQGQTHMTVVLRNLYPGRDMTRVPITQVWRELPQALRTMITQAVK